MAKPKYKWISNDLRSEICAMYESGSSAKEISRIIGYSDVSVVRTLKRYGIELRPHGHTKLPTKFCPDCELEKPTSDFYGVERGHVDCRCKPCRKIYAANWKRENREKSRAMGRDYANRNKGRWTDGAREWRRSNPAKVLAKKARRKARKFNLAGNFLPEEWTALCAKYQNKCLKCGSDATLTVDHIIPISKPGATNFISNIQPLCHSCNSGKCDRIVDYRPDFSCLIR